MSSQEIKRLYRSSTDRMIGGVCGGIAEYFEIDSSVRDHEPKRALVGGEKGTEFYERLSRELPPYLKSGGQLFLEIGASQGEVVKEIFQSPPWTHPELLQDWSRKDRFFFLEKQ